MWGMGGVAGWVGTVICLGIAAGQYIVVLHTENKQHGHEIKVIGGVNIVSI